MSDNIFYVYEHWRPDLDQCFWVGKGTGDRAYRYKRNRDYDSVIRTLAWLGMRAEVRMVRSGLTVSPETRAKISATLKSRVKMLTEVE